MISGTTRDDGSACNSTDGSCRYFRPDSRSDSFRNLNYQIGILHNLNETTNLFARFATAYLATQINEIYRLQKEQTIEDIKSQNLSSFEIGIKRYSESSQVEISAFVMNKDNVIIKDTNNIVVNDGQTDHKGIEWLLSYKLSSRLTLTNVGSFAKHTYSYSRLYGDIDINGNAIDTAPKLISNLSLKYEGTKSFTSELEIVHLDKYFLDPQNLHIYPGHSIANLRFTKELKNIKVSGQITNLTGTLISEELTMVLAATGTLLEKKGNIYSDSKRSDTHSTKLPILCVEQLTLLCISLSQPCAQKSHVEPEEDLPVTSERNES